MLAFRVQPGRSRERMRALTRSQRLLRYEEMSLTLSPLLSIPQVWDVRGKQLWAVLYQLRKWEAPAAVQLGRLGFWAWAVRVGGPLSLGAMAGPLLFHPVLVGSALPCPWFPGGDPALGRCSPMLRKRSEWGGWVNRVNGPALSFDPPTAPELGLLEYLSSFKQT